MHTTSCVSSKSGVSVSPCPFEVWFEGNQIPLAFEVWFSGPLPDPQIGKPDVGLRTFTPVGGLLWYNCCPVCESPTQQLRDLILLWLHPSYLLIATSPLSFDVGYLFGEFQCLPVDGCSAVSYLLCFVLKFKVNYLCNFPVNLKLF